ncbi:MAG: glycosyltransferase, partial [Desulfobulbia bacterium]
VTGYVTNPDNIGQYVYALDSLIVDTGKRQMMSRAAKRKFDNDHSFAVALKRLNAILNDALARKQAYNQ